ncbi:hypothetical protein [Thalassotalea sp. G2M2-11]|uniref:hypothetical protein n=1 Tax=Thalassotalea sp. G2M2-11 TaxID=2787627 RepID=UPI0019D25E3D|nr:hypothetical protein [Thalassotalea sp. G2M2-11]
MKLLSKILLLICLVSSASFAGEQKAKFDVELLKNGEKISTTTLIGAFEQSNTLEVDGKFKVTMEAGKLEGTKSLVSAQVYFFDGNKMVKEYSSSMVADLSLTPSFQIDSKKSPFRIEIKPRSVK